MLTEGDAIVVTPDGPDVYQCPACAGCHPFDSFVVYVNGDSIDAYDVAGDVDCFPIEWVTLAPDTAPLLVD